MKEKYCENYPLWAVFLTNLVSIGIYLIGIFIILQIGIIWLVLYLIYILFLEIKLMRGHCVDCYYYGKTCAFGRGRISSLFFKKGNSKNFCNRKITWKDLIPDFLVSLIPVIIGIVLLIINFSFLVLLWVVLLIILTSAGNAFVRGKIACKYCKQRKIGCPAEKLFKKKID
ncbi:hypothetical protein FJZ19_02170 [Candidatus Pacearchaeota archaeon]|nr:hypothetical protein [Candidatus Pacearchaeota archaeon]